MSSRRSFKQQLKRTIENLYKLQSQSLAKGKRIPQDILVARKRLEDFVEVLDQLRANGLRYDEKQNKIVKLN